MRFAPIVLLTLAALALAETVQAQTSVVISGRRRTLVVQTGGQSGPVGLTSVVGSCGASCYQPSAPVGVSLPQRTMYAPPVGVSLPQRTVYVPVPVQADPQPVQARTVKAPVKLALPVGDPLPVLPDPQPIVLQPQPQVIVVPQPQPSVTIVDAPVRIRRVFAVDTGYSYGHGASVSMVSSGFHRGQVIS